MFLNQMADAFCGQSVPSYEEYSQCWTLMEWWDVITYSKDFFNHVVNTSEPIKEVECLPSEYQVILLDFLNVRLEDMKEALIEKSHGVSSAYLTDFDWRLKVNLSSDKLASLREPVLSLDFSIQQNNGSSLLSLDLSKEELKHLIDSLEEINKVIVKLKP